MYTKCFNFEVEEFLGGHFETGVGVWFDGVTKMLSIAYEHGHTCNGEREGGGGGSGWVCE